MKMYPRRLWSATIIVTSPIGHSCPNAKAGAPPSEVARERATFFTQGPSGLYSTCAIIDAFHSAKVIVAGTRIEAAKSVWPRPSRSQSTFDTPGAGVISPAHGYVP